jgi:hypothetical protein
VQEQKMQSSPGSVEQTSELSTPPPRLAATKESIKQQEKSKLVDKMNQLVDTKFEIILFSSDVSAEKTLIEAAHIAQTLMNTLEFKRTLLFDFDFDLGLLAELMAAIRIKYEKMVDKRNFAATERKVKAHDIYINEIFREIIEKQNKSTPPPPQATATARTSVDNYKISIACIAFLIIHEIGHLIIRWKGINDSPLMRSDCVESGDFLEKRFFNFRVKFLFDKEQAFNSNTKLKGSYFEIKISAFSGLNFN